MRTTAKWMLAVLFCTTLTQVKAQPFKPGNKHFSVELNGGCLYSSQTRSSWTGTQPGFYLGAGVKRFFFGFLNTGLHVGYEKENHDAGLANDIELRPTYSVLSAGVETTPFIRFASIPLAGKSKRGECRSLAFYLLPTAGYAFRFAADGATIQPHQFYWGAGITTSFSKSGNQKIPAHLLLNVGFKRFLPDAYVVNDIKFNT
ncbi:MAG: hypothetical protein ACHQF2_07155, partial [Flavobacteriales bacterium]